MEEEKREERETNVMAETESRRFEHNKKYLGQIWPYRLVDEIVKAILWCFGFEESSPSSSSPHDEQHPPSQGGGEVTGSVDRDSSSTADPASVATSGIISMFKRKPPTPQLSSGKDPGHH